ncbi:MAG: hypothetical protein HQ446_05520 [Polaromonas sp.]|nr:hypothetical protein [Polaromonas sp.]
MKNFKINPKRCLLILAFLTQVGAHAGELRYVPVNPTFGGNPLNSPGLQANAAAQNTTKAPVTPPATPLTAVEKFTNTLEAAILNRVQSATLTALFDSKATFDPNNPTTIKAGNFTVEIRPYNSAIDPLEKKDQLFIKTTDTLTGQSTTINISSFGGF